MNRVTKDFAAPVPPKFMINYSDVHLDIVIILFVNNVAFLKAKSRDIRLIHFKIILIKSDKQVVNELISIVLGYEARGFKVIISFSDNSFASIIKWMYLKSRYLNARLTQ